MKKMIALSALFSFAMINAMDNTTWAQRVSSPTVLINQSSSPKKEQAMRESSSSPVSPIALTLKKSSSSVASPAPEYVLDPSDCLDWRTQLRIEAKRKLAKKK